jgi:glycine betaine catabolism A
MLTSVGYRGAARKRERKMLDRPNRSIGDLIPRAPGQSLPADLYRRPDVFGADFDVFFDRQWALVRLEGSAPNSREAYVIDAGRASMIVARGDDSELRAFHDLCHHRGARRRDAGR